MNTNTSSNWQWYHTVVVIAVAAVIPAIAAFSWFIDPKNPKSNITLWAILGTLLAILVITVGHGITGNWLGALIDQNNKMRLSRLQLIIWTIVILSAWLTAALWNLIVGAPNPLGIQLQADVWWLLGISTASLTGAVLIQNNKSKKTATTEEKAARLDRVLTRRGQPVDENLAAVQAKKRFDQERLTAQRAQIQTMSPDAQIAALQDVQAREALSQVQNDKLESNAIDRAGFNVGLATNGLLAANVSSADASPADLFSGDDVTNDAQTDIGKIQMFIFTIVLVVAYASAIGNVLSAATKSGVTSFPPLDSGMIAILGISHAGYLAYKAAPHPAPLSLRSWRNRLG